MLNIRRSRVGQKLNTIGVLLLGIYIFLGFFLYAFQDRMIFFPTELPQDYEYKFSYPFEEIFLKTDSNTTINALHFKNDSPKGVVLYFHGNAGDLSRWGHVSENFMAKGYDVLVMDYRTYGKSKGNLTQESFYTDAQYCFDYLKNKYNEHDISVYGRSLGSGIATFIASVNNPKQIILETPYYSVAEVAQNRFPIFPVKSLLKHQFLSNEFIVNVTCPITMFHGTLDYVIPIGSALRLYEEAPKTNTKFVKIENGNHNDLSDFDLYQDQIEILFP
ncbi:alpha/beta hydrolase [Hyunsoonleella aestuarii]|uniref:Alpha/beta fold hydrolase n=1 Tax=Hyunsoonleella aestuarii TaxID=912802 RepID=A0ABP8EBD6_9FLAO|nr:alpha/beta hydrolase [Hyunsoonleella aestuarii]